MSFAPPAACDAPLQMRRLRGNSAFGRQFTKLVTEGLFQLYAVGARGGELSAIAENNRGIAVRFGTEFPDAFDVYEG